MNYLLLGVTQTLINQSIFKLYLNNTYINTITWNAALINYIIRPGGGTFMSTQLLEWSVVVPCNAYLLLSCMTVAIQLNFHNPMPETLFRDRSFIIISHEKNQIFC
jgi:hypothetical protein